MNHLASSITEKSPHWWFFSHDTITYAQGFLIPPSPVPSPPLSPAILPQWSNPPATVTSITRAKLASPWRSITTRCRPVTQRQSRLWNAVIMTVLFSNKLAQHCAQQLISGTLWHQILKQSIWRGKPWQHLLIGCCLVSGTDTVRCTSWGWRHQGRRPGTGGISIWNSLQASSTDSSRVSVILRHCFLCEGKKWRVSKISAFIL